MILKHTLRDDKRPLIFIAKYPSQKRALLIAEMLDRRITNIDFNQTQVWLIFP